MKMYKSKNFFRTLIAAAVLIAGTISARADTTLDVGYIPIIPMSQLFVMEGEGWTRDAALKLELTRFSSGPAIVQALASGKMDVVYFGIGPAMVARSKGVPIKVVASGIVEQIGLIANPEFAQYAEKYGAAEGIRRFTADKGRKVKIASLPKGSVPDTVGRHWLIKVVGLSEDDVELIGMGASRVQQALLAGSVDAASILEPILTIVQERVPGSKVIARASEMLPNQPGSVVAVRESALSDKREAIEKLVALQVRATNWINEDPKRAAKHVLEFVGKGLVPLATIEKAMVSPSSNFEANPHRIIEPTKLMHAFQLEIGAQKRKVPLDELFDTSIYDKVTAAQ